MAETDNVRSEKCDGNAASKRVGLLEVPEGGLVGNFYVKIGNPFDLCAKDMPVEFPKVPECGHVGNLCNRIGNPFD